MNQRSVSASTHSKAITPTGSASAPAIDTAVTSRTLQFGAACKANGSAHSVSISSNVGAAMRGP